MVSPSTFNPSCYLPTALSNSLPALIACPPPPSYFSQAYNAVTHPLASTFGTIRGMLQTLVGLPFLSLVFIPVTGSYSTTLNLIFFYITWSTLILSYTPLRVEFISSLVVRLMFYVIPSLALFSLDALIPSAALSFKSKELGKDALPLRGASRSDALKYLKIIAFSIFNILLASTAQVLIEIVFVRVLGIRSALRVVTAPPSPVSIVKDLVLGYILRDILTYTIHRYTLHESDSQIARLHETWYHSLPSTFPLSASYDHPLPYLLHKFLPTYLPAVLFHFHLLTYIIYLTLISLEEMWTYSGYSTVPTNFILGGIARRTDTHLLGDGAGNFGTMGLVDWSMGTSIGGSIMSDVGAEAESHDVQDRMEKSGRKGIAGAKKGIKGLRARNRNGS